MHLAKGLEFRAVAVMACDDEVIPLHKRIETVADEADLEDVYNTERHLLYVACTRARDNLLVTSTAPASASSRRPEICINTEGPTLDGSQFSPGIGTNWVVSFCRLRRFDGSRL
jgi:superfamily I DNA/RNA helicase